ncbi:MAG: hypothetical protein ACLSVD_06045 [Eggerthellaceae bacterium]
MMRALQLMLGRGARVETASVEAVLATFDDEAGGKPRSGYVANIKATSPSARTSAASA